MLFASYLIGRLMLQPNHKVYLTTPIVTICALCLCHTLVGSMCPSMTSSIPLEKKTKDRKDMLTRVSAVMIGTGNSGRCKEYSGASARTVHTAG